MKFVPIDRIFKQASLNDVESLKEIKTHDTSKANSDGQIKSNNKLKEAKFKDIKLKEIRLYKAKIWRFFDNNCNCTNR